MPIQLNEENGGKLLTVHVSGKLTAADYEHFVPEFERLVGLHGKLHVLFDMTGFNGWTAGALWEDTKFAMHHFHDTSLKSAVESMRGRQCATMPVVAGGRIIGLLTLENISEMLMVNAAMDHQGAAHSLPPKLSTQNL